MGTYINERKHATLFFDLCETDMTAVPATSAQTGLTARRRVSISRVCILSTANENLETSKIEFGLL